jgi:hypothetical protein
MTRGFEHGARRSLFDDPSGIHDRDAVGHAGHEPQVVRDEQQCHAGRGLDLEQEIADLCLDGDVERRRRLVGDEQARPRKPAPAPERTRWHIPPESSCG